jgi:hypothetical protein
MVLMCDMQTLLQPSGAVGPNGQMMLSGSPEGLAARVAMFNTLRDNQGTFVLNKATEDFKNVSVSLAGLHELQAQAQEHMASVSRIPLVKLTGISPSGLNACLTGDTLIETDRGNVPIREVQKGQKVMTRKGWASIAKAGCTGYATELIEIKTEESTIRCTSDHRIWLPSINAFVPAENVRRGDLLLCRGAIAGRNTANQSHIDADSGGTEEMAITPPQSHMRENICFTERSGGFTTDLFRRATTFITSTRIARTINSIISNFLDPQITPSCMVLPMGSLFGSQRNTSASAATAAIGSSYRYRRELNFAAIGAGLLSGEGTELRGLSRVRYVLASCAARLSRRSGRMQNTALENARPQAKIALPTCRDTTTRIEKNGSDTVSVETRSVVSSVRRVPAQEFVYDIQVARGCLPEFFANGVCVHNSSEGEIRAYYDTIAAYQNRFFQPHLNQVLNFMQLSLWGEIDPEITFEFEPLWEMSEKENADLQKADGERDQIYVDMGALSPGDVRKRIIDDPKLPYSDLDPEELPDLREEEEQGLEPEGGRPNPLAEEGPGGGGGAPPGGPRGKPGNGKDRHSPFGRDTQARDAAEGSRAVMVLTAATEPEAEKLGESLMADPPDVILMSDQAPAPMVAAKISMITGIAIGEGARLFRPLGDDFGKFRDRFLTGVIAGLDKYEGRVAIVTDESGSRLMRAWAKAGFPADGSIDQEEFDRDSDKSGVFQAEVPVDRIKAENEERGGRDAAVIPFDKSVNTPLAGDEDVKPAESSPGGAHDQPTPSEDNIKNERLIAALDDPTVSSTEWLDQLRARLAEIRDD